MADDFSWQDFRDDGGSRLPGPEHLGWWVVVSLLLAIVLHAIAFLALGHVKILLPFREAEEIRTAPINLDQVEVLPPAMDELAPDPVIEQPADAATLLEEIDVLASLPEDHELDITPEALDPEFAIKPMQPMAEGAPDALETDVAIDFDLDSELPELGRTPDPLPKAEEGQVIVDPGAALTEDPALDAFTDEVLRKGDPDGAAEGSLDGVVSLDDMVGLPENVLVGKRTMLPSDLLFEYNSADLRESARVGLMKLALLVERNPNLYCWIEGHTDLFGGDQFNLDLSQRRAEAVKSYLVGSLHLPGDKIITRGYGKAMPLVRAGSIENQSPNRRVEIKMRRTLPPKGEPLKVKPQAPKPESPKPAAPKAEPVESAPMEPAPEEEAPRAIVVKPAVELPSTPTEDDIPRAVPVEEAPPRAVPVEE